MQEIQIMDGKLYTVPGGLYDMKLGNCVELGVAKLHLLVANVEKMIDFLCETSELDEKVTPYGEELMNIARKLYDSHYKDYVENYHKYKLEFNQKDFTIPAFLFEDPWIDQSWHNDAAPSFFHPEYRLVVWVFEDEENLRDYETKRFYLNTVTVNKHGEQEFETELFDCDTEEELIDFLANFNLTQEKE